MEFAFLRKKLSPVLGITLSFLGVILIGAFFLALPVSHSGQTDISPLTALFTSASAVCVTGLTTVVTAYSYSFFGKLVILILMQLGGLSLIAVFTFFIVYMGKKVSLRNRLTIQAAFSVSDLSGTVRMVLLVIRGTLICEAIGAAFLTVFFLTEDYGILTAVWYGIFHSVSAFCNAGFDIIGANSFAPFANRPFFNIVIIILVFIGETGFIVWRDVFYKLKYRLSPRLKRKYVLSVQSKLALGASFTLILGGASYFLLAEFDSANVLEGLSMPHKILNSLFQSVTLRTAGFFTFPQNAMKESSKLVSSLLMLVGGSPGGTAGGIKTVTVAVIMCSVFSTLKGYKKITVFGRTLKQDALSHALTVVVLMLLFWISATAILSLTEHSSAYPHEISDLLFEVSSALGTSGLSTGLTPHLTDPGQLIIIICMFLGRIGPISILLSLANRTNHVNERINYNSTDIMIG